MPQIRFGSLSITGDFRENNEDRCYADPAGRFFLVADGMGGQAAGERASEMAIEMISKALQKGIDFQKGDARQVKSQIESAIVSANTEIIALGKVDPASHNMGTTIAYLVCAGGKLFVGGIGDSRVYRYRDQTFEQLTTDHSLTQALMDAGTISPEEAAEHRYRNVLYRYLGTKEGSAGSDLQELELRSGDRFLLCSDGVTDGTREETLIGLLDEHEDPQEAAEAIVRAAQEGGSKDNITCMVVNVE